MLTTNTEKTRSVLGHATTVNKAALTAWLHAWTTGTAFAGPSSSHHVSLQNQKQDLATLRHARRRGEAKGEPDSRRGIASDNEQRALLEFS